MNEKGAPCSCTDCTFICINSSGLSKLYAFSLEQIKAGRHIKEILIDDKEANMASSQRRECVKPGAFVWPYSHCSLRGHAFK